MGHVHRQHIKPKPAYKRKDKTKTEASASNDSPENNRENTRRRRVGGRAWINGGAQCVRVEPATAGASAGESPRSLAGAGRAENARAMPLRAEGGGGGTKKIFKF